MSRSKIMIAATGSGRGKTTFVTGLLSVLKDRDEMSIHAFKCGPDYIDPMFHREVLGIQSTNLDSFFCDSVLLKRVFNDNSADINIIEAAMGLYDGIGTGSQASAYEVASVLECPIVLLVDGSGMGFSIVALIKGFLSMDEKGLVKAMVINRISERYFRKIAPVIEKETGVKVIGFVPFVKGAELKSRHLGLMNPDENEFTDKIKLISKQIENSIDIDSIIEIGTYPERESHGNLIHAEKSLESECYKKTTADGGNELKRPVIAVARDEAFSFMYEENIKLLEKMGAEVTYFSPIHDAEIAANGKNIACQDGQSAEPDKSGTGERRYDAVILYGGYPENYAKELSENISMKKEIRNAAESGIPILAECGGFMYLLENMTVGGVDYEMTGVLKGHSSRTSGLVRFGYVDACIDGMNVKGHEFHHFEASDVEYSNECVIRNEASGDLYQGIVRKGNIIAGFPHLYYLSNPEFVKSFLNMSSLPD